MSTNNTYTQCAWCNFEAKPFIADGTPISSGQVCVCAACGAFGYYDEQLKMQLMTDNVFRSLPGNVQTLMINTRRKLGAIRRFKRFIFSKN